MSAATNTRWLAWEAAGAPFPEGCSAAAGFSHGLAYTFWLRSQIREFAELFVPRASTRKVMCARRVAVQTDAEWLAWVTAPPYVDKFDAWLTSRHK